MAMSMKQGAAFFQQIALTVPLATEATLEAAAQKVETEAKRVIGTYEYGWPQLALATQMQREQQGFNPNDPLLRTGELRDSIQHTVDAARGVAYVGSNNPIAAYQELGTATIPPRSFLAGAAQHKEKEIVHMTGDAFYRLLAGGKIRDLTDFLESATRYLRMIPER